jgi:hypothetical protein
MPPAASAVSAHEEAEPSAGIPQLLESKADVFLADGRRKKAMRYLFVRICANTIWQVAFGKWGDHGWISR